MGGFVFFRNLIVYVLLVLYGVPVAIGPHWHSHTRCSHSESASPELGKHSHSARSSNHCSCEHSRHNSSSDEASDTDSSLLFVTSKPDFDNCPICHFYSCIPLNAIPVSTQIEGSLVESLTTAGNVQLQTVYQLHLARGPPADLFCA